MPTFTYGTTCIDYTIHYKPSKRDCTISVDWQTGVSVVVPEDIDQERIDAILRRKAPWILRKLAELREIKPLSTRHEFISEFVARAVAMSMKLIALGVAMSMKFIAFT